MSYLKRCDVCGAMCEDNAFVCSACGEEFNDARLDGIKISDYASFIDQKSDRYLDIFRKNENKKIFVHTNWAAFFFCIYWFFYRKMYAKGLLALLSIVLVSVLAFSAGMMAFRGEYESAKEEYNRQVQLYEEATGEEYEANKAVIVYPAEISTKVDLISANAAVNEILKKIYSVMLIAEFAASFIISLFADCLYRAHIKKRVAYSDGGVSRVSIIGAAAVMIVFSNCITPLLFWIAEKIVL